jgi:hypothetical protein
MRRIFGFPLKPQVDPALPALTAVPAQPSNRYPSNYWLDYLNNEHFIRVGQVVKNTGYKENGLCENEFIREWMDKFKLSTGEYTYSRGDEKTVYVGTSKYAFKQPEFNPVAFSKAWDTLRERWSVVKKSTLAPDFEDWLDLTTSPGYPYNLKYHTKKEALQDPLVREELYTKLREKDFNSYWSVRCKSEPLKMKKKLASNGRVIVAAPLNMQAPGATLFAIQNNRIYDAARAFKIPCTVGVTKYYRVWHALYKRLIRNGKFKKGLELDYTNFDGTCSVAEFEQLMNVRYSLLKPSLQTPEILELFRRYYTEIVYTKMILANGEVVMKLSGNPSGQVNTIVDNSIINEFRWYYAIYILSPDENLDTITANSELITCGDDSLLTVSPLWEQKFTPKQFTQVFEAHGWNPKISLLDWIEVHKLAYCSQSFRWLKGWVVPAPNNYKKLLASLLWGGDKRDARETLTRVLGVKIEAFFLPKFRVVLEFIIDKIFLEYYHTLRREPDENELTYSQLLMLNRDYQTALGLYLQMTGETPHAAVGNVEYFSDDHLIDVL